MSILKNAVDSIILGVEDYLSSDNDNRRVLSATRNLFAGILLLFKEKLARESPPGSDEVLIKRDIIPVTDASGNISWRGQGGNTADVRQIEERFNGLGIAVDWKRVHAIRRYRNDIEHYFSRTSVSSAKSMISDCFIVIRDFLRTHLLEDPLDLLGKDVWDELVAINDVYQKEKRECEQSLGTVDWEYPALDVAIKELKCSECGSDLIDLVDSIASRESAELRCRSCGSEWNFESATSEAISSYFDYDNYQAIKDGADPATIECPNCGKNTYILEDDICVLCGDSVERTCQRCGGDIPPDELDGDGYCGWCAHMMAKDD